MGKAAKARTKWLYEGAVMCYENVVIDRFKAETWASSDKQAKSQILAQAKKLLKKSYDAGGYKLTAKVKPE